MKAIDMCISSIIEHAQRGEEIQKDDFMAAYDMAVKAEPEVKAAVDMIHELASILDTVLLQFGDKMHAADRASRTSRMQEAYAMVAYAHEENDDE